MEVSMRNHSNVFVALDVRRKSIVAAYARSASQLSELVQVMLSLLAVTRDKVIAATLLGAKPDADEGQGLRRAQRASNANGARPGSHPITT